MSSRYPAEFKQKAVELVTIQRKSIAQVSLELNVAKPTLYYWLNSQGQGSIRPQMVLRGRTPLEEFHRLTTCTTNQATINVA